MTSEHKSPILWLPTLYFAKGMPYVVVTVLSLLLLRQMGLSVAVVTLLVSLFYLPWVLKPWWKPCIDRWLSYRTWLLLTEYLLMLSFATLAFVVGSVPSAFALLLLIAFLTSVHNVAVDEFYRNSLEGNERRSYRHVRELARKLAVVVGQGVIVMLVGNLQVLYRYNIGYSWSFMFYLIAGLFLMFLLWHLYAVPDDAEDDEVSVVRSSYAALSSALVFFLLCYGLSPAFQSKVAILFLIETQHHGGLGLSPQEFGLVMGSVGIFALTVGGLVGTKVIERCGLRSCLWPMAVAMLVPSAVYVYLSVSQPSSLLLISVCIFMEQLGFGFGYSAYLAVLRRQRCGQWGKSLMALSLLLPCACSGLLAELLDYDVFFLVTLLLGLLSLLSVYIIRKTPMAE